MNLEPKIQKSVTFIITLSMEKIEEIALNNIIASMSLKELATYYLDNQNVANKLQWAQDENGNFPKV